jgi:hypothetical protein
MHCTHLPVSVPLSILIMFEMVLVSIRYSKYHRPIHLGSELDTHTLNPAQNLTTCSVYA